MLAITAFPELPQEPDTAWQIFFPYKDMIADIGGDQDDTYAAVSQGLSDGSNIAMNIEWDFYIESHDFHRPGDFVFLKKVPHAQPFSPGSRQRNASGLANENRKARGCGTVPLCGDLPCIERQMDQEVVLRQDDQFRLRKKLPETRRERR